MVHFQVCEFTDTIEEVSYVLFAVGDIFSEDDPEDVEIFNEQRIDKTRF